MADPQPIAVETLFWRGRELELAWLPTPYAPPQALVTQVSGVCYTPQGLVVLGQGADGHHALPGGHPEPGETPLETLRREVREEICAELAAWAYLGAQRVRDPHPDGGPAEYYQLRYWARVELAPFAAHFETHARTLAPPDELLMILGWRATRVAQRIFAAAHALASQPCPGAGPR